jgi:hypothetical protein
MEYMANQGIGLIGFLILLIIGIIVLGYFGISLRTIFGGGTTRDNLNYAWQMVKYTWDNYLSVPAYYCWSIFYNLMWKSFIENAERIRQGKTPTLLEGQPQMPEAQSQQ